MLQCYEIFVVTLFLPSLFKYLAEIPEAVLNNPNYIMYLMILVES